MVDGEGVHIIVILQRTTFSVQVLRRSLPIALRLELTQDNGGWVRGGTCYHPPEYDFFSTAVAAFFTNRIACDWSLPKIMVDGKRGYIVINEYTIQR